MLEDRIQRWSYLNFGTCCLFKYILILIVNITLFDYLSLDTEGSSKRARKKATAPKNKFKVRREDVANIGGPASMLGKSMARCGPL